MCVFLYIFIYIYIYIHAKYRNTLSVSLPLAAVARDSHHKTLQIVLAKSIYMSVSAQTLQLSDASSTASMVLTISGRDGDPTCASVFQFDVHVVTTLGNNNN